MRTLIEVALAALLVLAATSADGYREVAVTDGGRIIGTVRVRGPIAPLPAQPVYKEKEFCGDDVPDERLVVDEAGALEGAVVHLVRIDAGKPIPRDPVRLDNRKCAFVPHVLVATVGQTLDVRNDDPFLHDAHALLGTDTLFNLAIPKGRTVHHVLEDRGIVHINCNIRHTWMHAYVFVTENPYRTVTDREGRYSLDDVPPGTYTIAVWHEVLGSRERSVTVRGGEAATVYFELEAVAAEKP